MSAPDRERSPEFDDFDYEPILEWANARVEEYDNHGYHGFTLIWKHGFIDLEVPTEEKARKAAALFIYLWTRGVYASFAERCATAYVLTYTIRRI